MKGGTSAPLPHHINTEFKSDEISLRKPDFHRPKTHHDQYIEQKAEEISQVYFLFCIHKKFLNSV